MAARQKGAKKGLEGVSLNKKKTFKILATFGWNMASDQARQDFFDEHVPGAVFFDIDECCDKTNSYPRMILNEELFAEYV